jgi:hypothetical protein
MKFSLKIALVLLLASLLSAGSVVYAQVITGENTVSPTSSNLNSVSIDASNSTSSSTLSNLAAMAVGDGGVIIRWNGTRWSTVNSNTSVNLYSIVLINATNAWAVGGNATKGVILRYNGTWTVWNTASPINSTLFSVSTETDGSSGWIVGANGINLRWDGTQWTPMANATTNHLRSVSIVHGTNNAWAVGDNGTIIMWNGSNWTNMTSPSATNLNAIIMVNSSMGWAVGGNGTNTGLIMMLNGTTWNVWNRINFGGGANATDKINATLSSITLDTANSAWTCGAAGTVLYWTGTEWAGQANIVSNNLKGIAMVHGAPSGTSYAWAVGEGGRILAWTGTSWIPEFPIVAIPILMSFVALAAFLGKSKFGKKIPL